jgi:predicted transcriptional regulator
MPTSVHISPGLLAEVDRKARALRISRNQLVVRALEREVARQGDWSPEFLARLTETAPGLDEAVDNLLRDIKRGRRSKRPPEL